MTNVRSIIITLLISAALLGLVAFWFQYQSGASDQSAAALTAQGVPGPVSGVVEDTSADFALTEEGEITKANATTTMENPLVTLKTSRGDITLELYRDAMPVTVDNFVKLAREGFYTNSKFHRVIDGFMIQGGDPNSKGDDVSVYGTGGPGYTITDEFVADPRLTNVRGTIAMANTGQPNSGGSQFFINLVDNTGLDFDKQPLSSRHPVFGRVVEGLNIVDIIGTTPTGPRDVPLDPVVITDAVIKE